MRSSALGAAPALIDAQIQGAGRRRSPSDQLRLKADFVTDICSRIEPLLQLFPLRIFAWPGEFSRASHTTSGAASSTSGAPAPYAVGGSSRRAPMPSIAVPVASSSHTGSAARRDLTRTAALCVIALFMVIGVNSFVHSIAFSHKEALGGRVVDVPRAASSPPWTFDSLRRTLRPATGTRRAPRQRVDLLAIGAAIEHALEGGRLPDGNTFR